MLNKKKKAFIFGLSMIAVCSATLGLATSNLHPTMAETVAYYTDVFTETSGMVMDTSVQSGVQKGLAFTAVKNDAYAVLAKKTAGDYKLVFGTEHYADGSFDLAFKNEKGEVFSIVVQTTASAVSAGIKLNGVSAGMFYKNGNLQGLTASYSAKGKFTTLATEDTLAYVRFDSQAMQIFVGNGKEELLVWDFSQTENDGYDIGAQVFPLSAYSVTLLMNKDAEKSLVIYEINNDEFNLETLIDNAGPQIGANIYSDAVVGTNYIVPQPYAYDLLDGKVENVYVSVKSGTDTLLANKLYTENITFPVEKTGTYTITYSAKDQSGNTEKLTLEILGKKVADNDYSFNESFGFTQTIFGVGSELAIPNCYYTSQYTNRNVPCNFTVMKDDAIYKAYESISTENAKVTFADSGEYVIVISPIDKNINKVLQYNISIEDEAESVAVEHTSAKLGEVVTFANATALRYPNGEKKEGNTFAISQVGKYYVEYGEYETYFYVQDDLISLSTEESYMNYGGNQYVAQYGMNVGLMGADATFTYNKVIDLSDNNLNEAFIEMWATPPNPGNAEVLQMQIVLTDVYDPSNYLTYDLIYATGTKDRAYARVAAPGQLLSGYQYNGNGSIVYHVNNQWGTYFYTSFYGQVGDNTVADFPIKLYLNYETKEAYVGGRAGMRRIADLDSINCYSTLWNGFTTGEVTLSIKAVMYNANDFHFYVKNIDGEGFDGSTKVRDEVGPDITVDFAGYEETALPYAVVDMPYSIFEATAFDPYVGNKALPVEISVYSAYGTADSKKLNVVDGCFTPTSSGVYTIEYASTDYSGNISIRTVDINVLDTYQPISMTGEPIETVVVGTKYIPETIVPFGGSGKLTTALYIFDGEEFVEVKDSYIFHVNGEYQAKYITTDYLGKQQEMSFVITAEYSEKPIFNGNVMLPSAFLSGKTYSVQEMKAKFYSANVVGEDCVIKIYLDDKDGKNLLENGTFTPKVDNSGDNVKLIYEATYGDVTDEYVYEIPTYIVNNGLEYSFENHFYTEDTALSMTEEGLCVDVASNASKIEFVNELLAHGFKLSFDVNPEKNAIGKINIYVFDSEDYSNIIKLSIINTGAASSLISVNDGVALDIQGSFVGSSSASFELSYNNISRKLSDADKYSFLVSETMYGEPFNGFASGRVRFYMTFEEVTESSQITITKISNQKVFATIYDRTEPQATLKGDVYEKIVEKDTVVEIKPIVYADVISMNLSATYSVKFGRNYMTSVDGVELKNIDVSQLYSFKCANFGRYTIEYTITDESNQVFLYTQLVQVLDNIAPEITLEKEIGEKASVGSRIILPYADVYDNEDGWLDAVVLVYTPSTPRETYEPETTLVFKEKGIYTIKYVAYDSVGNFAEIVYTVTVS